MEQTQRIDQWASALAARPGLDLQEHAKASPPDRLITPWLLLLAARSFAPIAVYEAFKIWDKNIAPHAPIYREFWRSVCEFIPSAIEAAQAEKKSIGDCVVTAEEGRRFHEAQMLEPRTQEVALKMYLDLSSTHALAAAQASLLGGPNHRLDGWRKYRGHINAAVIALQALAIGRVHLEGTYLPTYLLTFTTEMLS